MKYEYKQFKAHHIIREPDGKIVCICFSKEMAERILKVLNEE